jgi:hypothetical protein
MNGTSLSVCSYDVQVSTCFFDAYKDYNCFGEVFRHVEDFEMEERASMKFCVTLKKTATEIFEMLNHH